MLTACALASNRQAGYWRNSERLFRHALAASRDNCVAHNGLGFELFQQGKVDEAIRECQMAVQIDPRYDPAHSNLGRFFAEKKDYASAIAQLRNRHKTVPGRPEIAKQSRSGALPARPVCRGEGRSSPRCFGSIQTTPMRHNNLALTCQQLGQTAEAIAQFRQAIQLRPGFTAALNNLAWILAASPEPQFRDGDEAVRLATEACELTHYAHPGTLATLAAAYAERGQFQEAIALAGAGAGTRGHGSEPAERSAGGYACVLPRGTALSGAMK